MATLPPWIDQKFYLADGVTPNAGGKVFAYEPGTTTKKTTYVSESGAANTNPIILGSNGECNLWLGAGGYKIVNAPATDTDPPASAIKTWDRINIDNSAGGGQGIVGTIAELKGLDEGAFSIVDVIGYNGYGTPGGGQFYWDSTSTAADNGGTIFAPTISSGTGRWFRVLTNQNEVNVSYFGAGDVSAAIDTDALVAAYSSFGSDEGTLIIDVTVDLSAPVTIPSNVQPKVPNGGSFNIPVGVTLTMPIPQAGPYQIYSGLGSVRFSNGGEDLAWWWGGSPSSSDNTDAIQNAIDAFAGTSGGTYFSDGTWDCLGPLAVPSNYYWRADGSDETRIRYTGTTFQDFITVGTALTSTVNTKFIKIGLVGGLFKNGKARYVLSADWFNTGCVLEDVLIRDGIGLLYIGQGYLATYKGVRCQSTTPNRTLAGCTLAEWQEVHGTNCAPVMILNANVCTMSTVSLFRVGSEISDGITPYSPLILSGAFFPETVSLESCGAYTDSVLYSLTSQHGTVLGYTDNGFVGGIGSHYYEACDFTTTFVLAKERTRAEIRPFWYNSNSNTYVADNTGSGEVHFQNGEIYACNVPQLDHVLSSADALSKGSAITFNNVAYLPGDRITDGALPGGSANVYDATGTNYPMGCADGSQRTGGRLVCPPKIISNLTLATGTNGAGAYIDIRAGVFLREQGDFVSCMHPSADLLPVYIRLHPPTVSKWYRLFIGKAGQPFLIEYSSLQTEPTGNWITEFATDGAGAIGALSANPRLSLTGAYPFGNSRFMFTSSAIPVSGRFEVDDVVWITGSTTATPAFHTCTTAGSPGTWTACDNFTAKSLAAINAVLSGTLTMNALGANRIPFLNGSKIISTASGLAWDGTTATLVAMTITATLATLTGADLSIATLGRGVQVKAGTNGRINLGNVLVTGTVTVANTSVTANTLFTWNRVVSGGTLGHITITRNAGVGYAITSSSAIETSTIDVMLTEAT